LPINILYGVSLMSFSESPFPMVHIGDNQNPGLFDSGAFSLAESNTSSSCSSVSSKNMNEMMIIIPLREQLGNINNFINKIGRGHGEWELRPDKFWRQSKNSYFSETYVWKNADTPGNCLHVPKNENYHKSEKFVILYIYFNSYKEEDLYPPKKAHWALYWNPLCTFSKSVWLFGNFM